MTKEEKEKLIELSDLNREDNIKYISSEAQGIAIALDSDRFAPSICKLERAYICGRRKSEKRIEELEQENAELKAVERMALYSRMSDRLAKAEELLLELYDCIPSSMADSCKETLQKVALFFKDSEVEK